MNNQTSNSNPLKIIKTIYFYLIVAVSVITLSIFSFILIRRILVDTVFQNLKITSDVLYESNYNYLPECNNDNFNDQGRRYNSEDCEKAKEEAEKKDKERLEKNERKTAAEDYLYSILTIFITSVVLAVHILFVREKKSEVVVKIE